MIIESLFGDLPSMWETTTLGKICQRGGGFIQTGPFGSQLHAADYVNNGIPTIMPQNIGENRIVEAGISRITINDAERLSKYRLRPGDIVYSRRGDITRRALILDEQNGWLCGTGSLMVRLGEGIVDSRYVSYYLGNPSIREWIQRHAVGATMPNLNTSIMSAVPFVNPSLPEQHAIAGILGALDDKIELNRRMNLTLESMARAVFRQWFVENEEIKRWEIANLGSFLREIISGSRPKGGAQVEGIPSIGAENINGLGKYDYSKEKYVPENFFLGLKEKGANVQPGDVLLYKDGAQIGRKAYFDCGFPHETCSINEHVFILRSRHNFAQKYLFFWLDQDWMTQEIINLNSNSAQPGINKTAISQLKILQPPERVIQEFNDLITPMTDKIFANCKESRTLASLRDSLLPKLMRGEIKVLEEKKNENKLFQLR